MEVVSSAFPLRKGLASCALVATSLGLSGKGLGPEIDGHDWVVRANRLPTAEYVGDYGARTDVLFLNCLMSRLGTATLMGPPTTADCLSPLCYNLVNCSIGRLGCKLGAIVLRSRDCFRGDSRGVELRRVWGKSPFSVSIASPSVERVLRNVSSKWRKGTPTAGLLALAMLFGRCAHVSLYGFDGSLSVDGHRYEAKHNLSAEHALIAQIMGANRGRQLWSSAWQANDTVQCLLREFNTTSVSLHER